MWLKIPGIGNRKEMRNMKKQASSRICFVCGRENDISLKMSWYEDLIKLDD
jgi:hypothetical protein